LYQKYSNLISSKRGAGLVILIEAVVAVFIVATLAIETGNLGYYGLFFFLAGDIVRRIINLFKKSSAVQRNKVNAKKRTTRKTA
jgi:hypothetical protein